MTERPAYSSFAWAYDIVIEGATKPRIDFIVGELRARHVNPEGFILDAGCGTGSYSIALAQQGFRVCGFDSSSLLLRQAEQKIRQEFKDRIRFVEEDLRASNNNLRGDAILCRGVLGDLISRDERQNIIEKFATILGPSRGTLLLDVRNWETTRGFLPIHWQRSYKTSRGTLAFEQKIESSTIHQQVLEVREKHSIPSENGDQSTEHQSYLYAYTPSEIKELLSAAGFANIILRGGYAKASEPNTTPWLVATASIP